MTGRRFYVARNRDVSHAEVLLARARPYERIEDACADMGEGVVFDSTGAIVAFHERHEAMLFRHRETRMTHAAPELTSPIR